MGAEFNFAVLKASDDNAAIVEANALIDQAKYEHGHGGYSGSFAECVGVQFGPPHLFGSEDMAYGWLDEHAEKWGPLLIVRVVGDKYCVGANCSS